MSNQIPNAQVIRNETTEGANTAERVGEVLEELARSSVFLDTIANLKTHEASVGDFVYVKGHGTAWDGGKGMFRLSDDEEIAHRDADFQVDAGTSFNFIMSKTLKTIRSGDFIQLESGIRLQANGDAVYDPSGSQVNCDVIVGGFLENFEKGYVVPEIEGVRVESDNANVPDGARWERVAAEEGTIKLEWLGAKKNRSVQELVNPCQSFFNYAMERGYHISLDAGYYYIDGPIEHVKPTSVFGKGGQRKEYITSSTEHPDDSMGTCIYTDQNIDLVNRRSSRTVWKDVYFDTTQITSANNGEGYHDGWVFEYDLSYRVNHALDENIGVSGNTDAVITPGKGTNFIRYNIDDAVVVSGAGSAYSMRHLKCYVSHINVGFKIDEDDPVQAIDTGVVHSDIFFTYTKQAYHWLGGSRGIITGPFFQDTDVLPFEEKDLPIIYLRNTSLSKLDLPMGDHDTGVDDAETEGESIYSYPRNHVSSQLIDIDPGSVQLMGASYRSIEQNQLVDKGYLEGKRHMLLNYHQGTFLSTKRFNDIKMSALHNMFRDADILHTTRQGLLDGSGLNFETDLDEQIGTAPTSGNLSWYLNTDETLWRFAGSRQTRVNFGSASNTDFVELAIEYTAQVEIDTLDVLAEDFNQIQVIWYEGDASGSGGISHQLTDTNGSRIVHVPIDAEVFKIVVRLIGASSNGLKGIDEIFAYSDSGTEEKIPPFIQRGMSPVMQGGDGNWYVLDTPPDGGGAATWTAL